MYIQTSDDNQTNGRTLLSYLKFSFSKQTCSLRIKKMLIWLHDFISILVIFTSLANSANRKIKMSTEALACFDERRTASLYYEQSQNFLFFIVPLHLPYCFVLLLCTCVWYAYFLSFSTSILMIVLWWSWSDHHQLFSWSHECIQICKNFTNQRLIFFFCHVYITYLMQLSVTCGKRVLMDGSNAE